MSEPLFKLGDMVYHKAQKEAFDRAQKVDENEKIIWSSRIVWMIVEMHEVTTSSGMERMYICQGAMMSSMHRDRHSFNELELVKI